MFILSAMLAVVLWEIVIALDRATKRIIGVLAWLLLALRRVTAWLCFKILQVAILAAILGFVACAAASIADVPVFHWFNPYLRSYNGW